MKKSFKILASCILGLFIATSCNNCSKEACKCKCGCCEENVECPEEGSISCEEGDDDTPEGFNPEFFNKHQKEMCPEMRVQCEKWMKFDSLSEDEQRSLLKEKKAEIDKREAEIEAKKLEFQQKWANFDSLSIAEQKQLIQMKSFPKNMGPKFHSKNGFQRGKHHRPMGGPRHDGRRKGCPQAEGNE